MSENLQENEMAAATGKLLVNVYYNTPETSAQQTAVNRLRDAFDGMKAAGYDMSSDIADIGVKPTPPPHR